MSDFKEIDKAAKALEAAKKKREQSQHQVVRQENRLETEEKKQRSNELRKMQTLEGARKEMGLSDKDEKPLKQNMFKVV